MFANTIRHENMDEFLTLWNAEVLSCFVYMLRNSTDLISMKIALEGIYHMLNIGRKIATERSSGENMVLSGLENAGALDNFDELQDHPERDIQIMAKETIKEFMPFIELRPRREELKVEENNQIN